MNLGTMAVGNPPENALNGLSLKSLISVAALVRIIGTPSARGAEPSFLPIISRIYRITFKSFAVLFVDWIP
jgi:hypothetical protein